MPVVSKFENSIPSIFPKAGTGPDPAEPTYRPHDAEAPDAGEGRGNFMEHEFTHGRSQS